MDLALNREKVNNYVLELCRQNKVECAWHFSDTTNSMYYRICTQDGSASFRISDHAQKIITMPSITVGKSTKLLQIGKFVRNRINHLRRQATHKLFAEFMCTQNGVLSRADEFQIYRIGGAKYGIAR